MYTRSGWLIFGALLPGLFTTLSAAALSGSFNMSGILTATATTNTWNSDLLPNASQMFTLSGGTGSFAGENGQNGVFNMNNATEPVDGTTFAAQPFIMFDVVTGLPILDINFIPAGIGGSAGCSASPAVTTPPQTCTPAITGGSPFTFTNNPPPSAIQSTAGFVFMGVTSDGLSTWRAVFTSQFSTPFQTVLAAFAPGGSGSVTNTYSATVTVTPIPGTPEPAAAYMLAPGLGLLLLSLKLKKYRRDQVR